MESADTVGLCFRVPKKDTIRIPWTIDNFSKIDPYDLHEISDFVKADVGGFSTKWRVNLLLMDDYEDDEEDSDMYLCMHLINDTDFPPFPPSFKITVTMSALIVGAKLPIIGCEQHVVDNRSGEHDDIKLLISRAALLNDAATLLPGDQLSLLISTDIEIIAVPFTDLYDAFQVHQWIPKPGDPPSSEMVIHCVDRHSKDYDAPLARFNANMKIVQWYSDSIRHEIKTSNYPGVERSTLKLITTPDVAECYLRLAVGEKFTRDELSDKARGLLKLAFDYDIPLLSHLVENILIERLKSDDDAARCLHFARKYESKRLMRASKAFFNDQHCPAPSMLGLRDSPVGKSMTDCTVRCVAEPGESRSKRLRVAEETTPSDCTADGRTILQEFKLHRLVICSRSSVFRNMFDNSECEEAKTGIVNVQDIEPDVMQVFVDLLYNRQSVSDDTLEKYAEGLYYALDKYNAADILERLQACLLRRLNADNCLRHFQIAHMYSATELKNACLERVCANWDVIKLSDGLRHLDRNTLVEIIGAICQAGASPAANE